MSTNYIIFIDEYDVGVHEDVLGRNLKYQIYDVDDDVIDEILIKFCVCVFHGDDKTNASEQGKSLFFLSFLRVPIHSQSIILTR